MKRIIKGYNLYKIIASFENGKYIVTRYQNWGFVKLGEAKVRTLTFPFLPRIMFYAKESFPIGSVINPARVHLEALKPENIVERVYECHSLEC